MDMIIENLQRINIKFFKILLKRYGRYPKSSEIGCVLSHFNAIKFSKKNKSLIIF